MAELAQQVLLPDSVPRWNICEIATNDCPSGGRVAEAEHAQTTPVRAIRSTRDYTIEQLKRDDMHTPPILSKSIAT